ncbi:hypothetical protein MCOR25_007711 [Pyricularia grisea]|uniref:Heterokaryon incompatibility domain-containing protein n=1 Tax=Pyricularia grisea TaxID=148305 RepID=A0A6P8BAZ8_PYRGI|nr:uncharacterized protein PgNI_02667 [Pyricularia grisea]KAI6357326.1 hypothetical protein MCOR25_007711 [Pyricularia grisea]TLD12872.1 hypothetical protein PgNI_02667 [Pyricularia grisea]
MWLINAKTLRVEQFDDPSTVPQYVILSHTWEDDEVSFQDVQNLDLAKRKKGFSKIGGVCTLAIESGVDFAWVDTCCIDKTDSVELGEAINSMYRWYAQATVCIVYLSDLPATVTASAMAAEQLHTCKWFTRGWTLQELIAPRIVKFYNSAWHFVGSKSDHFASAIASFTNIAKDVLLHNKEPSDFTVAQRMSWACGRKTKRPEDRAYSLLGLFDISLPPVYGEQDKAFQRLQEEVIRTNPDMSILAWHPVSPGPSRLRLFALSPDEFQPRNCPRRLRWGHTTVTNMGLKVHKASLICVQAPIHPKMVESLIAEQSQRSSQAPDAIIPFPFRQDVPECDNIVLYALVVGQFQDGNTCAIFLRKTGPGFFQREMALPLATIPKNFRHPLSNLRYPWDAPDKVVIYTTPQQHSIQHVHRAIHFPLSYNFRCKFSLKGEQAEIQPNRTDWDPNTRVLFRPENADSLHVVPLEVYIDGETVKLVGLVNWYIPPRIDLVSRDKHPDIFNYLVSIPGDQRRRWIDLSTFIGSSRLRPMGEDIVVVVRGKRHRIGVYLKPEGSKPKMYTAGFSVKSIPSWDQGDDTAVETGDESLDEMEDNQDRETPDAWGTDSNDSDEVHAKQRRSLIRSKDKSHPTGIEFLDADMRDASQVDIPHAPYLEDGGSPSFQSSFPPRHLATMMPSGIEISDGAASSGSTRQRHRMSSASVSKPRESRREARDPKTIANDEMPGYIRAKPVVASCEIESPGLPLSSVPQAEPVSVVSPSKPHTNMQEGRESKKRLMRERSDYLSGLEKKRYLRQVRARKEAEPAQILPASPRVDLLDSPPSPRYSPVPSQPDKPSLQQMNLE